ncbi:SANT domain [Sesbania bispinosa]|nr:SANT domain [Sesbania bispinosa]
MDSLCFGDNKEDIGVKSAEGFPTSELSGVEDEFGDPEVLPRVGDQYQAEIPSLIAAPYCSQLVKKTRDSEIMVNSPESYSLGLPIPLKWSHCKFERSFGGCGGLESVTSEEGQVLSENECARVEVELQNALHGEGKNVGGFSHFQSSSKNDETDIDQCLELKTGLDQPRGKYLLPGLLADQSWTDLEYNSFLLGLYVFGKNLNFLKRFVGSKNMGDILSFYYGKFFRSKGYSRWSECRKLRTRRCIYGQKIFTGWRQQELLSRLSSHVPGECQAKLVEMSRNFGEGKMPFEEYVFALKDVVGIDLLIAAVGIGKGKQDLTGTAVEPTKTNHINSARPEIPIGKAWSTLTSADIIKFLTGNFRLSKARSSDLFWEAVWPRLLAKGWHSEQPKDNVSGSKQSLVFLVPSVKKFSRRRLVKGNHYFDSISDVLNKVASDPGLLETEIQATEDSVHRENKQEKQDLDGVSNRQQCHYLQSHSSKCNQDLMKFTIIDTSMVHDKDKRKVRQMRTLPSQIMSISIISSCSSESERDTSEDSEDQVEQANASSPIVDQVEQANASRPIVDQVEQVNFSCPIEDQVEHANSSYPTEDQVEHANAPNHVEEFSDKGASTDTSDCARIPEALNTTKVEVEIHKFHSDLHNDEHSREIYENNLIQKMTSDCTNDFPCITKMQILRACNNGEFSHCAESTSVGRKFDLNEPISPSNLQETSEGMVLSEGLENLSFPSYHAKDSPNMSNEGSVTENHLVGEVSAENSKTRMLIDLNFPQVPPEFGIEMEVPSSMVIQQNDNQCENTLSSPSELSQHNAMQEFPDDNKEQSINVNRRQSTRNRPLTTKALEALEYRFINSKRKRKNTESSENNSKSQCLGVNSGTVISATCDKGIENSIIDSRAEEENVIRAYSCSINLSRGSL